VEKYIEGINPETKEPTRRYSFTNTDAIEGGIL